MDSMATASHLHDISFAGMRAAMVDSQLRTNDVIDPAIVAAMGTVEREDFAPDALRDLAYIDRALSLGDGRAMNAPLVTGRLLVAAAPRAGERVLLVGAATGYTAALLARLGTAVIALEADESLVAKARTLLAGDPVRFVVGPLADGAPDGAPYDVILIDGAVERVPDALIAQLVEGGRIVGGLRDGAVTRLVRGVKVGGGAALRAFADMDAVALPGFAPAPSFAF